MRGEMVTNWRERQEGRKEMEGTKTETGQELRAGIKGQQSGDLNVWMVM